MHLARFAFGRFVFGLALLGAAGAWAAEAVEDDPNLWLADIHGEKALAWVKERNAKSEALLKSDPRYPQFHDMILKSLDIKDRIPAASFDHDDASGVDYVTNFWQDAGHVRGLWRRTTLADYETKAPHWQTLLDLDKLDADEHEQFVWQGADCAPKDEICLLRLSPGGGDAALFREFVPAPKPGAKSPRRPMGFVKRGFEMKLAKSSATYLDAHSILFATDFGPGSMTKSSYPRIVKLWREGQKMSDAKTVFEGTVDDISARPQVYRGPYGTIPLIVRGLTFFTNEYRYVLPDGSTMKLPLPPGANLQGVTQGNLIFTLRDAWTPPGADKPFAQGSLVAFPVMAFVKQKMQAKFTLLYTPDEHSTVDSIQPGRDAVYASIFTDVTGTVHAFRPNKDGTWSDARLAAPTGGSTSVVSANDDGPQALFTYESFLVPPTLYAAGGKGAPRAIKSQAPLFDARDMVSEQHWVTSSDGVKVPYFLIHKKGLKGDVPTILYSYGGFELALTPWYWNDGHRPIDTGQVWLSRGGAIAVANIRGGGEFGPRWHQAALKANRQKAFDDFAAVAKDLEDSGFTSAAHVGIVGASNGGVLTTVTMTQHPELLRAVVCQRPLVDMLRYTRYGAGASWVDEYGDPDKPEERAYIEKYSAYQNVKPDVTYPSILFITETSDDRVTPIWARMMARKMEEQGHQGVLFDESFEGGHGPGATNKAQADMWALSYVYLARELEFN